MKKVYTIKKSDIGKSQLESSAKCKHCGTLLWVQSINTMDFMGKIQPHDVGKRIYFNYNGSYYCVESDSQLKDRLK